MIEIIRNNNYAKPIEEFLPVRRVYGRTERLYLNSFLFCPDSIVKNAVDKAVSNGFITNEYMEKCNWAEDMGTVFDNARCEPTKDAPRGELYAEEIDIAGIEKMTGICAERLVLLRDSLVGEGILRSKHQKPVNFGFGKK
jgi:hypothetical protein